VQEAEVRFQLAEVGFGRGERGPEDGVVVGEEREEDAEEEGGCCCWGWRLSVGCSLLGSGMGEGAYGRG